MATTAVAPAVAGVKVGDFFTRSWGYDETHVDFYKVVGLTPKGVRVQRWSSRHVDSPYSPVTHVVPGEKPRMGAHVRCEGGWREYHPDVEAPVETKRLSSYDGGKSVYISVGEIYSSGAYPWDGSPQYETGVGWGR